MWLPLMWISLIASPPLDPVQLTQRIEQISQRQRDEVHLLNVRLPNLSKLAAWGNNTWRSSQPVDFPDSSVPIRIVHLWADWCPPCKAEFPRLKRVVEKLHASYGKEIRLVLVSETLDDIAMSKYLRENSAIMPSAGVQFGDTPHELMWTILQAMPEATQAAAMKIDRQPGRELPLPITLVTDAENVVRLAFVGSLEGRYGQFINGIEQLYRTQNPDGARRLLAGRSTDASNN